MLYDKKWDKQVEAPVKLEPWQQVFLDAAAYIRKYGWHQGSVCYPISSPNPRVCIVGSLYVALGILNKPDRTLLDIGVLYEKLKAKTGIEPASWNDSRNRTKEEVIAVLEGIAQAK